MKTVFLIFFTVFWLFTELVFAQDSLFVLQSKAPDGKKWDLTYKLNDSIYVFQKKRIIRYLQLKH